MKKCSRCGIEKEFTEFGKLSNTKDGFNGICKECRNDEARAYRRKKGLENGRIVKPPKRKDPKAKEKECTKCGKVKLLKLFAKDKLSGDGRSAACLDCRNKQAAKYRDENRELIRQKLRARYTKKPKKLKRGKLKKQQRIQIDGLKICLYCGVPKPFDEFRDQKSFQCKYCCDKKRTALRRSKGEKSREQRSIEYRNRTIKKCSSCKRILPKSNFQKNRLTGDGLQGRCRECDKIYYIKRRLKAGKEAYPERKINKYGELQSEWLERQKTHRRCRFCKKLFEKHLFIIDGKLKHDCPDCREYKKSDEYKEFLRKRSAKAALKHRNKDVEKARKSFLKWQKKRGKERHRERMETEPEYALNWRMRDILSRVLRRTKSIKSVADAERQLGYTAKQLKKHLESKFLPGMTWKNRGKWHIDHIKPIAVFVNEGETDPAIINALDNLQPLWAEDNWSKGANYIEA